MNKILRHNFSDTRIIMLRLKCANYTEEPEEDKYIPHNDENNRLSQGRNLLYISEFRSDSARIRGAKERVRVSGERERERSPLRGLSSVNAGGRGESERERG